MSDQDRSSVTVRIAGEEHTLRSNAPPEYTRKCAKLVSDRIDEIRSRALQLEPHRAAILAALSIADEYFRAVEDSQSTRSRTRKSSGGNGQTRIFASPATSPLTASDER